MGWASGSSLAEETWGLVRRHIPLDKREEVANQFIAVFEDMDCDTMDEAEQLIEDANRPETCWNCGEEFPRGSLEDDECEDCRGEE